VLVEERASDAFDRLTGSLRRILRSRGVRLDLGIPGVEEGADRMLPGDVVNTVSAVVRVLEQLARGRRNRDIAEHLHISEAAALAHRWGAAGESG
jgi:hypothetical protein